MMMMMTMMTAYGLMMPALQVTAWCKVFGNMALPILAAVTVNGQDL
jgi:hypothetical protein